VALIRALSLLVLLWAAADAALAQDEVVMPRRATQVDTHQPGHADNNRDINPRSVRRTRLDALGRFTWASRRKTCIRVTLKARDPQGFGGSNPSASAGWGLAQPSS
jgi:hypothetical protein